MQIFNFIDFTANTNAITCDYELARIQAERKKKEGHHIQVWEGTLRTQGRNFSSWANNWKRIDEEW